MSLFGQAPSWSYFSSNISGTPSATGAGGTAVTAGANNVDAAVTALLSAVTHDIEYLTVSFCDIRSSGANGSALADILFDPAGGTSWQEFIPDLLAGQTSAVNVSAGWPVGYHFPIWIPAGSTIGVRLRTSLATDITTGRCIISVYGGNRHPASWWCGQRVEAIGINAATSQGTNHTAGASGAFSAWTNFGSTLSQACKSLQFAVQGTNTDTTQTAMGYHFEFGVDSVRIGPPIIKCTGTTEAGWHSGTGVLFKGLPAASQLMVRATSSGAAEAIDVAAYAVS